MEGPRWKDLRGALAFLRELYADPDLKGFQSHILSALPRLVPAEAISYNAVNPRARRNEYVSVPAVQAAYEPAFLRHMGDHPLITHYQETRDGRALRVSDLLPRRRFHGLALYNEFFRPRRMEFQVAFTSPRHPRLWWGSPSAGAGKTSPAEKRICSICSALTSSEPIEMQN